jgi:hypothetical protein
MAISKEVENILKKEYARLNDLATTNNDKINVELWTKNLIMFLRENDLTFTNIVKYFMVVDAGEKQLMKMNESEIAFKKECKKCVMVLATKDLFKGNPKEYVKEVNEKFKNEVERINNEELDFFNDKAYNEVAMNTIMSINEFLGKDKTLENLISVFSEDEENQEENQESELIC